MVQYNFKKITVVPTAKDFVDIVLSKTQRKTPTVVHKGQAMTQIRRFYIRKVKFASQTYHDKLAQILDEFPVLSEVHPFYADLMNVLYDKDHYKLALGQLSHTKSLVDQLGKDYVRLLKYGDSLYRCKQLKRAALGRMCTLMKKQQTSLAYLEEVRQHLARLPSIDPNTRTLVVCGYPNVGKSSFMNKMTRANVEVQPYAFTTKSLFVGHMDYRYIRWQVIDTPGILDHPLDDMNTIEMQSITALVHLKAAIVFVMDISERCGYSLAQQTALFNSIKPLFASKPLVVAVNKIDVLRPEDLPDSQKELIRSMEGPGVDFVPMSTFTEEGIADVKRIACDKLLAMRVENKLAAQVRSASGGQDLVARLHVAQPVPRDEKDRGAFIPQSVLQKKSAMESNKADSDDEDVKSDNEMGTDLHLRKKGVHEGVDFNFFHPDSRLTDPTIFGIDFRKDYDLKNPEWKFDAIPEVMDGRNILDFIDPDIDAKLAELEAEEEERLRLLAANIEEEVDLNPEDKAELEGIRTKKKISRLAAIAKKRRNRTAAPLGKGPNAKSVDQLEQQLTAAGVDPSAAVRRARSRSQVNTDRAERGRKRERDDMDTEEGGRGSLSRSRSATSRDRSRSRSVSRKPGEPGSGFKDEAQHKRAERVARRSQTPRNRDARRGEADRHVAVKKPKHLFSGKRGIGKTDRR